MCLYFIIPLPNAPSVWNYTICSAHMQASSVVKWRVNKEKR